MAVTHISTGILAGNLFDGWVESPDAYEQAASARKYADIFEDRLRAAFPGATITVELQHGVSGSPPHTYVEADDYRERDDAELEIDRIAGALYEDYDAWLVGAESE